MRRSWVQDVRVSAVVISFLAEHPDNAMRGRQTRPAGLPTCLGGNSAIVRVLRVYLVAAASEKELRGALTALLGWASLLSIFAAAK